MKLNLIQTIQMADSKEKLVEKALSSLQLIQDVYKEQVLPEKYTKGWGKTPMDYPDFKNAWDKSNVDNATLKAYLDKTGDKLVNLGDNPFHQKTRERQSLSMMLGDEYVQSDANYKYKGIATEDLKTGNPYSVYGWWLSNRTNLTPTINLSGDESFEGWKDKSTPLMEPIVVKGRR